TLFSAGGAIAMLTPKSLFEARFILTRFPPRNKIVKPLVLGFLACGIPLQIQNLLQRASVGVGNTIFQRSRTAGFVSSDAGTPFILTYFTLWSLYAAPLFLTERPAPTCRRRTC